VGGGIRQYREARALFQGEAAHREYLDRSFRDACGLCEKLDLDLVRTAYWRKALESSERSAPTPGEFVDARRAIERFGATHGIPRSGTSRCIPRERVWLEAIILRPDLVGRLPDAHVFRARHGVPGPALPLRRRGLRSHERALLLALELPRAHAAAAAADLRGRCLLQVDKDYLPFRKLSERFPDFTLPGGIRSEVLHCGTVAAVVEEAKSAVKDAKGLWGSIIGCSNQIVTPAPERNTCAKMETLDRLG
jgi:hypothetical protein